VLARRGALAGASDHGATKSVYGRDPDGNEFEVMWILPRDQWGEYEHAAPVQPLDLEAEIARHGRGEGATA
jgi:catechol-2,3-dioxygenase